MAPIHRANSPRSRVNHACAESSISDDQMQRLREMCLALPETTGRLNHGDPTWFIRSRRKFVTFASQLRDDRLAFWCAASEDMQLLLVEADPERFFVRPYLGHRYWLGVYLDVSVDWDEIADIVVDAYRDKALKSLLTQFDGWTTGWIPLTLSAHQVGNCRARCGS